MLTILIADDDRSIRHLLNNCLRNAGHAVLLASNGREAVEKAIEHRVDLVLMDMNMPEIDGWTAARMIKHMVDHRIQIIAITSYGLPADEARAIAAGCNRFLVKPVDAGRLMESIEAVMKELENI